MKQLVRSRLKWAGIEERMGVELLAGNQTYWEWTDTRRRDTRWPREEGGLLVGRAAHGQGGERHR